MTKHPVELADKQKMGALSCHQLTRQLPFTHNGRVFHERSFDA
ncbi:MAG: hypothetical protein WB802_14925 [Candidatus Dormiibacterota bacterium]|jgi:hypothetical protein